MDQDLLQLSRSSDEFGEVASEFIPHTHPSSLTQLKLTKDVGDHNNHNAFKYKYSDWEMFYFDFSHFFCFWIYSLEQMKVLFVRCIGHQAPDIPNIPLVPIHSAVQYLFLSAVIVYFSPTILLFQFIFTQPGKWKGRDRDAKENMHQIWLN